MSYASPRVWLGLTTALVAANPAIAQNIGTPLGRVVLGWGTEQVALDTPQATTVIDQTEIEQQQATTVGEFFDQVPGVEAIGSDRVLGQTFNIRGFGDVPAGDEGRVIVQQDGATQYYEQYRIGSFFGDPSVFCNIEVLRGPASATLYGGGAIGGVVRFETCTARDYLEPGEVSQLRFTLGGETNGDGRRATIAYAAAPSEDLELLFNVTYRDSENYVDGDGTEIGGSAFDALTGLISAVVHLEGNRQLRFSYERWNSDLDDTAYEQTGTSNFGMFLNAFGNVDRDTTDQTLSARYESPEAFGDLEVTFAYAMSSVEQTNATDPFGFGGILFEDTDYGYTNVSLDARVANEGLQFGNLDATLIYGATLYHQDREAETAAGDLVGFHPEGTLTRLALFGQAEVDYGNGLVLIPGLRVEYAMHQPGRDDPAQTIDTREEVNVFTVSPKLAFTYDVNTEWGVFGSISQTQRAPNLDEYYSYLSGAGAPVLPATDLDPETARSVELGFTYSTGGLGGQNDALDLRATAFYSRVDDIIETNPAASATEPSHINAGEAEFFGFEFEAAYESEQFFARTHFSSISGRNLTTDEIWDQTPQQNLGFTVGGRIPDIGLEYGWRANFYNDIEVDGDRFGDYQVHDIFVDWRPEGGLLEGSSVQFGIDNVFDTTYQNSLDDELGRGRSFRLTALREF
ncbi:MAG: TonB-dependent receptor [Pseudomonadota bacterium]